MCFFSSFHPDCSDSGQVHAIQRKTAVLYAKFRNKSSQSSQSWDRAHLLVRVDAGGCLDSVSLNSASAIGRPTTAHDLLTFQRSGASVCHWLSESSWRGCS